MANRRARTEIYRIVLIGFLVKAGQATDKIVKRQAEVPKSTSISSRTTILAATPAVGYITFKLPPSIKTSEETHREKETPAIGVGHYFLYILVPIIVIGLIILAAYLICRFRKHRGSSKTLERNDVIFQAYTIDRNTSLPLATPELRSFVA